VTLVQVVVTGYYSSSRRAAQTPCEDIQIRFPLPEPWVYLFRVERRFKYGSVHSATRRPGRIRGLERLTQFAQGILPPSLIEVSAGLPTASAGMAPGAPAAEPHRGVGRTRQVRARLQGDRLAGRSAARAQRGYDGVVCSCYNNSQQ